MDLYISCRDLTKNYNLKYKLGNLQGWFTFYRASTLNTFQNTWAWALEIFWEFFFFSFYSYFVLLFVPHTRYSPLLFHFSSSSYTKTKICISWKLSIYIKDCNKFLSKKFTSKIKFDCLNMERPELFILKHCTSTDSRVGWDYM